LTQNIIKQKGEKTMTTKEKMNPKKTARVAGVLWFITLLTVVITGLTRSPLIEPGDAIATANNIMASESQFLLGFVSDLSHQVIFILYVLVLYKLLKPVNKNQAALMVVLALVGIPIAMLNQLNQLAALLLLSGADYLTAFQADQWGALVMLFLDLYETGIHIAMIFWGLWLLPFGYLVFKSGYIPRILGVLLIIAGFGYLIDVVTFFLFPTIPSIALFTWWGELLLPLWLIIKGVNVEQWEKRALESA
jgi:hypothetical protein